jgi:hypothetical protein
LNAILKLPQRSCLIVHEPWTGRFERDFSALIPFHWREIALYQDRIPLDIDYEQYRRLEFQHKLMVLACRDLETDHLVGYSIFIVVKHIHYKSTVFAMNDMLWLRPNYRRGLAGYRLVRESERVLRQMGAQKINWHCKLHPKGLPMKNLLQTRKLGYEVDEVSLGRML